MVAMRIIPMTDALADTTLLRLMTWLSPAFPTGSFAWSSGLEAACRAGMVRTSDDLQSWIEASLASGMLRNDAILCAAAFRNEQDANALALSLAGSKERYSETTSLGAAFVDAASVWRAADADGLSDPIALPVAVGQLASEQGLPLHETLLAYLQSATSNQVQAALRLMKLGQAAAMVVTHDLEPVLLSAADLAFSSSLDDLGSCTIMTDIASMQHETLSSRIFRS